ncbi:unnamed protein product [Paramecium sonneborni]|uniref:DH domain-containing protein n=1 Tax=Paramecium sonneborni TaxID=65129 RepID=A0A8S1MIQ6_9CILI|nr:unnamed protein product [Paramecium sonneborni]
MFQKLKASIFKSSFNHLQEAFRMTRWTGCTTEQSKSQLNNFEQLILDSSQNIQTQDELSEKQYQLLIKNTILIQSYFKSYLSKKKYAYMKKWAKYRKHVYQELIITEQVYLSDLKAIIDNILIIAEQQNLLPENEIQTTFSNICHIYNFNKKFYEEIIKEFNNYHPNSCFGNVFQKFIPFFKIYFQYYADYKSYQINYLRQTYQDFDKHLFNLEKQDFFRGTDLNSFLVKPIQRLPKYALLIKDLVKHTWKSHPDYQNLQQTFYEFNLVTFKINHLMGNILKNQALFDLQKKFFDPLNVDIVESTRNFILTETVYLKNYQEDPAILYLCNDLIIISKKTEFNEKQINERLLTYLYINEYSQIWDASQDSLTLIFVTQDQNIKFMCQDQEQQQKLLEEINNLIKANHQSSCLIKSSFQINPVRVFVTQVSRGKSRIPFKTYAKFEILVVFDKREYRIWTRHKILLKIQNTLKKQYQKDYESMKETNILFQDWIKNKLNKQNYDGRKVIVETFLEILLNSQYVKSKPESYLKFLDLPQNFYQKFNESQFTN